MLRAVFLALLFGVALVGATSAPAAAEAPSGSAEQSASESGTSESATTPAAGITGDETASDVSKPAATSADPGAATISVATAPPGTSTAADVATSVPAASVSGPGQGVTGGAPAPERVTDSSPSVAASTGQTGSASATVVGETSSEGDPTVGIRVRRDTDDGPANTQASVPNPAVPASTAKSSGAVPQLPEDVFGLAESANSYTVDRAKAAADKAVTAQKQVAFDVERAQFSTSVSQYNIDATALNGKEFLLIQENASLKAAIAANNAAAAVGLAPPGQQAALAAWQASLNTRIVAYNAEKSALDARAVGIRAVEAGLNVRAVSLNAEQLLQAQQVKDLAARKEALDQALDVVLDEYAARIASGHAFKEHIQQFPQATSKQELEMIVRDTVKNADVMRGLYNAKVGKARAVYFKKDPTGDGGVVVFLDSTTADGGTIFRRDDGLEFVLKVINGSDELLRNAT